jgi:hypothetical protein
MVDLTEILSRQQDSFETAIFETLEGAITVNVERFIDTQKDRSIVGIKVAIEDQHLDLGDAKDLVIRALAHSVKKTLVGDILELAWKKGPFLQRLLFRVDVRHSGAAGDAERRLGGAVEETVSMDYLYKTALKHGDI